MQGLATQGFFGGGAKVGLLIAEPNSGDINLGQVSGGYQAIDVCDTLMLLRQVIPRYGTTPAGIRAGLESLGTSRNVAVNLSTRLDATRHDGAAGYRLLRFEDGCSCFQYQGPVYATG